MATYYVNRTTGNNANTGGAGDPWHDIWYAVDQVAAGDTIRVQKATNYPDEINIDNGYPNNVTIRGDNPADPPVIAASGTWDFDSVSGWTLQDLIFNGYSSRCIRLGNAARTTGLSIIDCVFKHATSVAIHIVNAATLTLSGCLFRDIRSRSAGSDMNAVQVPLYGTLLGATISDCFFEDIGSDGIHIFNAVTATGIVIEDCVFCINRPYSTGGTSLYNGDTTTWQNFSTNVGEGGIDVKAGYGATVDVTIQRCGFYGFHATVAGQDASGGNGEGIIVHNDAWDVTIEDCLFYDCGKGIAVMKGSAGTTAGATINRCLILDCDYIGLDMIYANEGVTFNDGAIVSSNTLLRLSDSTVDSFRRNVIVDGTYGRGGTNTGEGNFEYNRWHQITPPAAWADATDLTEGTVNFQRISCLDGGAGVYFERSSVDLQQVWANAILKYHPSLAAVQTGIDKVLEALASGAITTTLTEEATDRYSLEIAW